MVLVDHTLPILGPLLAQEVHTMHDMYTLLVPARKVDHINNIRYSLFNAYTHYNYAEQTSSDE